MGRPVHTGPSSERIAPTLSTLLKLAWPIVVSRSTQAIVGLCDALMVAHLGETALAATSTGSMNAYAVFILPMGTVFIVASFSSQFFGKGDLAGARRFGIYGLIIAAVGGALCMAMVPALPWALTHFNFTPEVKTAIDAYLSVRLFSGFAVVGLEALASYYGGLGNTRIPMVASVIAMVLNILGNWVLIDGRWGAPALGVTGAAWASAISSVVAFFGLLTLFIVQGRRHRGRVAPLQLSELRRTLFYGLPSGLNWFFEFLAFIIFINVVVAALGTTALAAMMAVLQLSSVAFMPAFGLASAGAIVVGQAIGARVLEDVPTAVRRTFLLAAGWQGLVGLVYLAIPAIVFAPFVREQSTPELMVVGVRMLMLSSAWQLFDAAVATLAEALRAAGDTAFPLWARLVLAWVVFVPGAWLTVQHFGGGEVEAMLWLVAYLGLLAAVLFLRFRSGAWRRFDLAHA